MNKLLMMCCLVLATVSVQAGTYTDISVDDLETAIKEGKVTLLDVNGTESFKKGHIPGALDLDAVTELAKVLPTDKDALIVAYCGGPKCRAYKAGADAATELGYKNVKHLSAGIKGWKKAGKNTEAPKAE